MRLIPVKQIPKVDRHERRKGKWVRVILRAARDFPDQWIQVVMDGHSAETASPTANALRRRYSNGALEAWGVGRAEFTCRAGKLYMKVQRRPGRPNPTVRPN